MRRKGISELLGATILVVITLILATIFYAWASGQLSKNLDSEERFQQRQRDILGEKMELTSIQLLPAGAPTNIDVTLQNTGTSDTEISYVTVHYSNGNRYFPSAQFNLLTRNGANVCGITIGNPCNTTDEVIFNRNDTAIINVPYNTADAAGNPGSEDTDGDWVIMPIPYSIDTNGNGVTDTIVSIEAGTILGGKYIFTKPTAVIKVKSQYMACHDAACTTYDQVFVLDGSDSWNVNSTIMKWEWIFYCDPSKHAPVALHPLTTYSSGACAATPTINYGQTVSFMYNGLNICDNGVQVTTGTYNPYILLKVTNSQGMVGYVWLRLSDVIVQ